MAYESYSCVNTECEMHGKQGLGNIAYRCQYGKKKDRELLYCKKCGKRFSAESQTLFQYTRLPKDVVCKILNCLCSRMSLRATSRQVGVHLDTVRSIQKHAGEHFEEVNRILVNNLKVTEVQLDEFWSYIKKKKPKRQRKNKS